MIRYCFFEASESKKHKISELCSAISQAAIYGTTHFAIIIRELIAEEFSAVKLQTAAFWRELKGIVQNCGCSLLYSHFIAVSAHFDGDEVGGKAK